jgi:hypothetical protein
MHRIVLALVCIGIWTQPAFAQSTTYCPNRTRNAALVGAGVGAVLSTPCGVGRALVGAGVGAFRGASVGEGTSDCLRQEPPDHRGFAALPLTVGDVVYVTDLRTGVEVSGRVTEVTPTTLAIDGYTFQSEMDLKIDRRGHSLWKGAAIGFALGSLVVYPVIPEIVTGSRAGSFRPTNGLLWAGIGALIDRAHAGRTTIYDCSSDALRRSVRLVPDVGAHRKGAALVVQF